MIDLWVFIPACFALNLAFGPNNLLALTNGAQNGVFFALRAGMGRILAFVPMIAASGLGLGIILSTSATIFMAVKILGAAYLIWLGIKLLRGAKNVQADNLGGAPQSVASAFRREAMVAVGNPKAILIFAAFFPQFVDMAHYTQSYVVLGGIFLVLELLGIAIYALTGRFLAKAARTRLHWFQRASGAGMVFFGCLLLLAKRPTSTA